MPSKDRERADRAAFAVLRDNPGCETGELVRLVHEAWRDRGIPYRAGETVSGRARHPRSTLNGLVARGEARQSRGVDGLVRWWAVMRYDPIRHPPT